MNYKNKQLIEKIMFENSLRYHTKKEGYPYLSTDINKLGEKQVYEEMDTMDEQFTARMLVDYTLSRRGITLNELGLAPVVVLSWDRRVVQSLAETSGAQRSQHWLYGEQYPLYTGEVEGHSVSFAQMPVGASATVMVMEEIIACGARVFLGLGFAGSLQAEATVGTCLIPTTCIREEGTSVHYIDNDVVICPSLRLVKIMQESCQAKDVKPMSGPVWTTDAPYRELLSKIETYHNQGVLGVDMETSAMYALGQFREVEVCNLLVVSDELWHEWRPAFGSPELLDATKRAERVILHCLTKDLIG